MTTLTADDLAALARYDTPTICNALEVVAPASRGRGHTIDPLVCARPELGIMVGYAKTARIRAREPSRLAKEDGKARRFQYFDYIAEGPQPGIMVIQDLDGPRAGTGSYWGEVNSNIHKALGCLGVVTDGSIRDLPDNAAGFQLIAGRVGPSHAFVNLVDWGLEVNVAGMTVRSGDLVHADQHGAVVIPHDVAKDVPAAADLLIRRERVIIDACQAPDFTVQKLKDAIGKADEIH